jgi:O-antigen ligase
VWNWQLPRQFTHFILFVVFGTSVAVLSSVSIRWWFPPLLRWLANILVALFGYRYSYLGILTLQDFERGVKLALFPPLVVGGIQAILGLAPYLNGAYRVSSTFGRSPLGFSLFLLGAGLLSLSTASLNIISVSLFSASFLMTILTYSRLSLVALVVSSIFVLLLQDRLEINLVIGLVVVILSTFVFSGVTDQLTARFSDMGFSRILSAWRKARWGGAYQEFLWLSYMDSSVLLRVKLLVIGLDAFQEKPFLGRGFGSFVPYYEKVVGVANVAAHNDYLRYLVETGLIGFVLYILLQVRVVGRLIRCKEHLTRDNYLFSIAVAGAYLAVNILSFLSNPYYFYEIQLWIWLGMGVSYALIDLPESKRRYSERD